MKKLLAILAVVLFATTAYALPPYAGVDFPNADSRLNWDGNPLNDVYMDFFHGSPGNPLNVVNSILVPNLYLDPTEQLFDNDYIQFTTDEEGVKEDFMWQTGDRVVLRKFEDQVDLVELGCNWYDIPEYIGCTEYFFLYVYQPLNITCVCETYKCIGIFSRPSYHQIYNPMQINPFEGNTQFSCTWNIIGQPMWHVVLSGEVLYTSGSGVLISWDWFLQGTALAAGGPIGAPDFTGNNFTTMVTLTPSGNYFAGLAANTVDVTPTASYGVHTWEATVSGFYYF